MRASFAASLPRNRSEGRSDASGSKKAALVRRPLVLCLRERPTLLALLAKPHPQGGDAVNPTDRFDNAGFLLCEAADHVQQAARILTTEAARAERLTRGTAYAPVQQVTPPPRDLSMQDLTELATKLGERAESLRATGVWLSGEEPS